MDYMHVTLGIDHSLVNNPESAKKSLHTEFILRNILAGVFTMCDPVMFRLTSEPF